MCAVIIEELVGDHRKVTFSGKTTGYVIILAMITRTLPGCAVWIVSNVTVLIL